MFPLKPVHRDSVASALAKAEHYRHLNEPAEAESICRDILEVEPEHQLALICLILAQSDEIVHDPHAFSNAMASIPRLHGAYERSYYSGILWERRAKARHQTGGRGMSHTVYEWLVKALKCFEEAEQHRPPGNDDAVLRWNTCVRFLKRHPAVTPRAEEVPEPIVSE